MIMCLYEDSNYDFVIDDIVESNDKSDNTE